MSTAKDGIDIDLINEAIDASIEFEALMDSIDFNSYLLEANEKIEVNETSFKKQYDSMIQEACKIADDIIKKPETNSIILQLFNIKKERLEARK